MKWDQVGKKTEKRKKTKISDAAAGKLCLSSMDRQ